MIILIFFSFFFFFFFFIFSNYLLICYNKLEYHKASHEFDRIEKYIPEDNKTTVASDRMFLFLFLFLFFFLVFKI